MHDSLLRSDFLAQDLKVNQVKCLLCTVERTENLQNPRVFVHISLGVYGVVAIEKPRLGKIVSQSFLSFFHYHSNTHNNFRAFRA